MEIPIFGSALNLAEKKLITVDSWAKWSHIRQKGGGDSVSDLSACLSDCIYICSQTFHACNFWHVQSAVFSFSVLVFSAQHLQIT